MSNIINKVDLVKCVADEANLPQATIKKVVEATLDIIKAKLSEDLVISIAGFGVFSVKHRAARNGRNPKTGESIQIKAVKVPVFKSAKLLKEAVNANENSTALA